MNDALPSPCKARFDEGVDRPQDPDPAPCADLSLFKAGGLEG
jgi:hypothetical protein